MTVDAPGPSIEAQRAFYDQWNAQARAGAYEEISREIRLRGERLAAILRELGMDHPRILEVGCGTGWLTEKLCELGRVTAIDLSRHRHAAADIWRHCRRGE